MNNLKAVLAVTGKPGAGKETFARLTSDVLRENGVYLNPTVMEFGTNGILGKMADYLNILRSRDNLQRLPTLLKDNFPGWHLSKFMEKQIMDDRFSELIIVDGVRWLEDEQMIRNLPVPNFMVYVHANPEKRWERIKKRQRRQEDANLPWEKFLQQDGAETEINIDAIGSRANYKIDNNLDEGDQKEYKKQVRAIINESIVPLFRKKELPS